MTDTKLEYIHTERLMDMKEVDRKLEKIVREGSLNRFFIGIYTNIRDYFRNK